MNKWNNKFRYQVASCWLFILSYTAMHGSMNIKVITFITVMQRLTANSKSYDHTSQILIFLH